MCIPSFCVICAILVLSLAFVSGQSPCHDVFEYKSDTSGVYGVITVRPTGPASTLQLRANFSIATRLNNNNYAGRIQPQGASLNLLQEYNSGIPLLYRVDFPVQSPLPRVTSITVNDNVLCYGSADIIGPNQYVTTASLAHTLFLMGGQNPGYLQYNPQPQPQGPQPKPENKFDFFNDRYPSNGSTLIFTFEDDGKKLGTWNMKTNLNSQPQFERPLTRPPPAVPQRQPEAQYYLEVVTQPPRQPEPHYPQVVTQPPRQPEPHYPQVVTQPPRQPEPHYPQVVTQPPRQPEPHYPQVVTQPRQPEPHNPQVVTQPPRQPEPQYNPQVVTQPPRQPEPQYNPQVVTQPPRQPEPHYPQVVTQPPRQPKPHYPQVVTQLPRQPEPQYYPQVVTQPPRQPAPQYYPQVVTQPPRQPEPQYYPQVITQPPQLVIQRSQAQPPVTSSNACGVVDGGNERQPLVFNGQSYDRGDWPWLVAIYKKKVDSLTFTCSGTLISDKHVVTAAHCMGQKNAVTSMKDIIVKVGAYNLEDYDDDITVTRTLARATIHEEYNASSLSNDILVLTFLHSVQFNTNIRPACLWSGKNDLSRIVGASGVVAGWGQSERGEPGHGEPQAVRIPVVSNSMCRASNAAFHYLTSSTTLCAGDRKGSGPCLGDSGGGLYLLDDGLWRLRGVVSQSLYLANGEKACNLNEYVVFTDSAKYISWIQNVIHST